MTFVTATVKPTHAFLFTSGAKVSVIGKYTGWIQFDDGTTQSIFNGAFMFTSLAE